MSLKPRQVQNQNACSGTGQRFQLRQSLLLEVTNREHNECGHFQRRGLECFQDRRADWRDDY